VDGVCGSEGSERRGTRQFDNRQRSLEKTENLLARRTKTEEEEVFWRQNQKIERIAKFGILTRSKPSGTAKKRGRDSFETFDFEVAEGEWKG
jgi:hypothetical protein